MERLKVIEGFTPRTILIIQLRKLGDVLLTTPVIKALRVSYPDARISFLTEENAYDILSGNRYLDEIITVKRRQTFSEQLKLILNIRRRKFDLILDFMANPRTAYLSFFSGAKVTVAPNIRFRGLLYKVRVRMINGYVVDQRLNMLSVLGIKWSDNNPCIYISREAANKVSLFLESAGVGPDDFLVCIDPTHGTPTRKWTGKGFAEVADRLKEQYNAKAIFLWGPGEREEVEGIMAMCNYKHIIDPGTGPKELAALLKRSNMLIGTCSFPRHVAASQGTPSLTILGATGDEWTYPAPIHQTVKKGLPCQPCNRLTCADLLCMTTLSVDEVMEGVEKLRPLAEKRQVL